MARAAHADQYTSFVRAGRTAKAQKHLTQAEGDGGGANMGMQPYRLGCVDVGGPAGWSPECCAAATPFGLGFRLTSITFASDQNFLGDCFPECMRLTEFL